MSESEHDESEFYYPDEITDEELIQETTSIEKDRNLMSSEDIHKYIRGQQQTSTLKKTKYDMNFLQRFLDKRGEKRSIKNIPAAELDSLLCSFYIQAKKQDNTDYEPDTISSFSRSIQRFLDDNDAGFNILKDERFMQNVQRCPQVQETRAT
ncbi:hypothetical protein QZH41_002926 [Actinostola sp. cb2023]|nr:hypothetical protein QZH41_002926 [Actinostola sp. cb2023]